jgi:dienelactone hydrolase|tara:strand:- start:2615 stop:4663 length:2049 start_codon:yes stop_codon:yes gene_type:complete
MKAILLVLALVSAASILSAAPRALPVGKLPDDKRFADLKDLNGYFPFTPPTTKEEWGQRSEKLRHALKVSVGLFPEPDRSPLNPVIHGKIDCGNFTIEKVYFETRPGFFLTGSLYRPKGGSGKRPGVLCPHGHWNEARFYDAGEASVKKQIKEGAEAVLETGRNPIQARCVGLARLGCTVLQYDMLGYCDNDQISYQLAHRFAKQRPEMIAEKNWGLYTPQAESHLQSIMMLQTWNSMRAIDFLQGLDDVDPERIAVTGASGGGTQTFVISALDPRVKVSMPAVMVSTAMQGGCTCENSTLMRVTDGNIAFAALFAPKPLGLIAADDWTKEMATKGFPELKKTYEILGAPDKIMLHDRTEFGHNYNLPSRQAMYRWFNEHLDLGSRKPDVEQPYKRLTEKDLTVWDDKHPKPKGGDDFERKLLVALTEDSAKKVTADPEVARRGWEVVLDSKLQEAGKVEWQLVSKKDRGSYLEMPGLHNNLTYNEQVPVVWLYPKANWNKHAVIWLSPDGKAGLYDQNGEPRAEVKKLLADGNSVCGIDLFLQGEFVADGKAVSETRRVMNPRESAAYTLGYNRPLFVQRLHDVLSAITMIRNDQPGAEKIDLVGLKGAGHWAAAANFVAGEALDRVAIETGGFEFIKVKNIRDPDLLPGASKYGDVGGLIKLAAKEPWVVDEKGLPDWLK